MPEHSAHAELRSTAEKANDLVTLITEASLAMHRLEKDLHTVLGAPDLAAQEAIREALQTRERELRRVIMHALEAAIGVQRRVLASLEATPASEPQRPTDPSAN